NGRTGSSATRPPPSPRRAASPSYSTSVDTGSSGSCSEYASCVSAPNPANSPVQPRPDGGEALTRSICTSRTPPGSAPATYSGPVTGQAPPSRSTTSSIEKPAGASRLISPQSESAVSTTMRSPGAISAAGSARGSKNIAVWSRVTRLTGTPRSSRARSLGRAGRFVPAAVFPAVGRGGRGEALDRGAEDPGADLAAVAARQPAVDDRADAGLGDLHDVDADRRAAEPEVGDL